MTGRVIIVTGANSGIGYETARYLCEGGNDVILACRSEEKANRAIEKIKLKNPSALATYMNLDLTNLESVQKFVDDFHASEKKLHVLINGAGMVANTKDSKKKYVENTNFELTVASNHLGAFLLTNLLLDDLKKAGADGGDARIINLTCSMHDPECVKKRSKHRKDLQPLDLENLFLFNESTYSGWQAYKNSKLMNVMFTYELARQLDGSGVTANCVCPGYVPGTELMRNNSKINRLFARVVLDGMLRFTKMTRSVQQAALQVCNLATEEKCKEESGKYFKDGNAAKSSEESMNEENQKKLWELSGGYLKMDGFEAIDVPPPPVEEVVEEKKEEEPAKEEAAAEEDKKVEAEETKEEKTEEVADEEKEKEPEDKEKEPEDKEKADVGKDEKEPEDKMEELEPEAKEAEKEIIKVAEKVAEKIEENIAIVEVK